MITEPLRGAPPTLDAQGKPMSMAQLRNLQAPAGASRTRDEEPRSVDFACSSARRIALPTTYLPTYPPYGSRL